MNEREYIDAVNAVLVQHTERAATRLRIALDAMPPKTRGVAIAVFVDQGTEGFLSVRVTLSGPDLYVLNKAIRPHASLFETVMKEDGLDPGLPLMAGDEFAVGNVLTDAGARWAQDVWKRAGHDARGLPVVIESPEGYGTVVPIRLQ